MEFKNENEFEQNQPNSLENTENTKRDENVMNNTDDSKTEENTINNTDYSKTEENTINNSDYSKTEENVNAVDATFTVGSNEFEENLECVKTAKSEEFVVPPIKEQTRSTNKSEKKKWKGRGFVSTIAAGVIGSVLTLAVLPHTDYMKNFNADNQVSSNSGVKTVTAQPTAASPNSIADTVDKVSKAIVGIVNYQQQQNNFYGNPNNSQIVETGSGSGVIIQKNNDIAYIVTNNHVVEGASKLEISLYDGQKTTAEVVGTDALTDLAVLKINAKYVTATADFGDSSSLRPGDQVYAIGNPLGLNLSRTVTQGIVSATDRSIPVTTSAGNWETNVIQTDAAINPGNSGGALINPQGQVIGINSLKIAESGVEGLGFAIPSNDVIPIVNELIKSGKIDRPYLGVGLADLDQVPQMYWENMPENAKKGVLVLNIDPNSAAASAGFQPKDVIVSINGTEISNSAEFRKYLYTKVKTGDTVKFDVYRDGKQITLTTKLTNNKGA